MSKKVAIFIYEGVNILDVTGPAQVFASASCVVNSDDGRGRDQEQLYETVLVARSAGLVTTDSGIQLNATSSLADLTAEPFDTLIIPGGMGALDQSANPADVRLIRMLSDKASRTASVCTGAFILAESGVLSGRRATTHWDFCDRLRERYPEVRVDNDVVYTRDQNIWCSAGVTAGIDLALAMIEIDCGHQIALDVAKRLVVFLKRPARQTQCSATLLLQMKDADGLFDELHAWIADNLEADLSVEILASRMCMSPRTFARRYTSAVGRTPAKAVEALRIEAARRLLEHQAHPFGVVARRCGFGNWERMRRAFMRNLGRVPHIVAQERPLSPVPSAVASISSPVKLPLSPLSIGLTQSR